jgi:hypothetical protein
VIFVQRAAAATAVALSSIALLSACSMSSQPSLDLPAQNRAEWVLPLDEYVMDEQEAADMYYAWTLLSVSCMKDSGYALTVPSQAEPAVSEGPTWNSVGRSLFNTELASQFGYHFGAVGDTALNEEWETFKAAKYSESETETLKVCQAGAWSEMPEKSGEDDFLIDFQFEASAKTDNDDDVIAAEKLWRTCMLPVGISDLPDRPTEMPSPSQVIKFGIAGDDSGRPTDPPTAAEIPQALADAECRESSGYSEADYQADWTAQSDVLQENLDEITRARTVLDEYHSGVQQIIAEHAASS